VKAALEKRGLKAEVDTSTNDDIHVAAYKSYHTTTPNGYNLQISYVTHDHRLSLANAVKPKSLGPGGQYRMPVNARTTGPDKRASGNQRVWFWLDGRLTFVTA
jgi:hypothetical protein